MTISERKITELTRNSVRATQYVNVDGKTFMLYCNSDNSMIMGSNLHLCIKVLKDDETFSYVIDNRTLGLNETFGYAKTKKENEDKLHKVFNGFIEYLEELYKDDDHIDEPDSHERDKSVGCSTCEHAVVDYTEDTQEFIECRCEDSLMYMTTLSDIYNGTHPYWGCTEHKYKENR